MDERTPQEEYFAFENLDRYSDYQWDGIGIDLSPHIERINALEGEKYWYTPVPNDKAELLYTFRYSASKSYLLEQNPSVGKVIDYWVNAQVDEKRHFKGVTLLSAEVPAIRGFSNICTSESLLRLADLYPGEVEPETILAAATLHIENLSEYAYVMPHVYEQYLMRHALNYCKYYYEQAQTADEKAVFDRLELRLNLQLGHYVDARQETANIYDLIKAEYRANGFSDKVASLFIEHYIPANLQTLGAILKGKFSGDAWTKWTVANIFLGLAHKHRNIPLYKSALSGLEYASNSWHIKKHTDMKGTQNFANNLARISEFNRVYLMKETDYKDPYFLDFSLLELTYIAQTMLTAWMNFSFGTSRRSRRK